MNKNIVYIKSRFMDLTEDDRVSFANIIISNGEMDKIKSHPQGSMISLSKLDEKLLESLKDFIKNKVSN